MKPKEFLHTPPPIVRMGFLKRALPFICALLLLSGTIWASAALSRPQEEAPQPLGSTPQGAKHLFENDSKLDPPDEMRAVWVPYMTLNMAGTDYSEQAFHEKFDNIIRVAKECGLNTLIVQVRPYGDALYPSEYFPWSHLLTGEQGKDPGYDPLAYMVEAAHREGMQIHAWLNPLRIQLGDTPAVLAETNPYRQYREDDDASNDDWVLDWEDGKYLNPAVPQVRERIIRGVEEIVENYPVDGIHFDDYFYPTTSGDFDTASYEAYCNGIEEGSEPLTLLEWRTSNINTLISGVYSAIKAKNPEVEFGISPQGNVTNDENMGADVRTWGSRKGYVDYLCPQVYVNFEHPLLPYNVMADTWRELVSCEDVKLYYGLAVYKAGSDADEGTWKNGGDILKREVEYSREKGCDGFMLYAWEHLQGEQAAEEVQNVIKVFSGESSSEVPVSDGSAAAAE